MPWTFLFTSSTCLFPSSGSIGATNLSLESSNYKIIFLKLIMVWFSISQSIPNILGYGFVSSKMSITSKLAYVLNPSTSIGTWVILPTVEPLTGL